jgi:hypothetical protein
MSLGYNSITAVVPTPRLWLVVLVTVLLCVTMAVSTYALVTFHIKRVCKVKHVMGPRLTSLTRDDLVRRAAIATSPAEGNFT